MYIEREIYRERDIHRERCVCKHTYESISLSLSIYIYIYIYICVSISIYLYICIYIYVSIIITSITWYQGQPQAQEDVGGHKGAEEERSPDGDPVHGPVISNSSVIMCH